MPVWLVKLIIVGVAVSIFTGSIVYYGKTRYDAGHKAAMDEVAEATTKANEATKKKQAVLRKKSNEVIDEIKKNRSDDRPVSRVIRDQLVRMRAND